MISLTVSVTVGLGADMQWRWLYKARGAPWVLEEQTRNWPNCTAHHESDMCPPLLNSFRRHCRHCSSEQERSALTKHATAWCVAKLVRCMLRRLGMFTMRPLFGDRYQTGPRDGMCRWSERSFAVELR